MRKLSGIFLVGLCLGAIGAVAVTMSHATAEAPKKIAVTESVTSMSEPPGTPSPTPDPPPTSTPTPTPKSLTKPEPAVTAAELDRMVPGGHVSDLGVGVGVEV